MSMPDTDRPPPPRAIRAAGPRPGEDSLRRAYLELLKLCLCDLVGDSTRTVTWTGDRRVFSRELTGEDQLEWRVDGKDWPQNGLSMIGLRRLDDLQECVSAVVRDGVEGDLIEAGTWRGGAAILTRATLDALGADDRRVWVADSFKGFPVPESDGSDEDRELELHMSRVAYLAPTLDQVRGYFARFGCDRNVEFVPGFFEETIHTLRDRRWSLVRLDADTYKATRLALEALYPGLAVGGYLIIDDYYHPYIPTSCRRAVDDFRTEHGITEPIEQIDWNSARWRRQVELPKREATSAEARDSVGPRAAADRDATPIPTDRELQLTDQLEEVRARLREAEARLAGRSAAGAAARMRRELNKVIGRGP